MTFVCRPAPQIRRLHVDMTAAIAIIVAYLIGSFPTAYIVARLRKGIDIRTVGSRNMGAMNVGYQVGVPEGILVVFVDVAKGALAVFIAAQLGEPQIIQFVAGGAAVIGHAFPVYLKFHGGKGGATCMGVLAYLVPWAIPFYLGLLVLATVATRYLTFSYSVAFLCVPFVAWLVYDSAALVAFSILLVMLPAIKYIPRVKEMYATAGSWRRVVFRSSFKVRY